MGRAQMCSRVAELALCSQQVVTQAEFLARAPKGTELFQLSSLLSFLHPFVSRTETDAQEKMNPFQLK